MKIITSFILTFLMYSSTVFAVDLGPFNVTMDFCKDVNKIGSILNAFNITSFPVAGLPGIASMVTMRTSPIVDMCSFINQVRSADTAEAIFLSAEKLNSITKKGNDDEIALARATFNLANSQIDFRTGKRRASSLDAVYTAQKLGDYMRKFNKYQDKQRKKQETQEQAEQINNLARIARERAILEETSKCPVPKDTKDYSQVYASEYQPQITDQEFYQRDMEFAQRMLVEMGPRFLKSVTEWKLYDETLQKILTDGVTYNQSTKTQNLTSWKKTNQKNPDGSFIQEKETVKKDAQVFSIQVNDKYFNQFESKFGYKWSDWVIEYWNKVKADSGNEDGLKKEFSVFAEECAPSKLSGKSFDPFSSRDQQEYDRKAEDCSKQIGMDRKKAVSYFSLYLRILKNAVTGYKRAKASIWSLDSLYLGRNRVVTTSMKDDVAREDIVCSDSMSMADMQMVALKSQSVNVKINETIAEESVKTSQILQQQEEREREIKEDQRIRQEIANRTREEERRNNNSIPKSVSF